MISREQAEQALALRAEGLPVHEIARRTGHSRTTISDYVNGRRTPGHRTPRPDQLEPFSDYCRHRLSDDPYLGPRTLFHEVTGLGYTGSRATFYRALNRHSLLRPTGPQPYPRQLSAPRPTTMPRPSQPLPRPVSPVTGETLASYLTRLATANHISTDDLLTILPPWFQTKLRHEDDRRRTHHNQAATIIDAIHCLAVITARTPNALRHALPAFAAGATRAPVRIATACLACLATRGIHQPVPVYRPASEQICTRHRRWLPPGDRPQLDLTTCPEITAAQHLARRLLRHLTPQQLMFHHLNEARAISDLAPAAAPTKRRQQRLHQLLASNRKPDNHDDLVQATLYPDALRRVNAMLTSRTQNPQ